MTQVNDEVERTLWCGNIHEKVTEELLYELFLQAGPLERVKIVEDKGYGPKYAFVTFKHSLSIPYTLKLMNGIRLFGQPLRLKERNSSSGNTGGLVEAVPPQRLMGPPLMMPPSLTAMTPTSSPVRHAGLLRSSSEPERLGSHWHENQRFRRPEAREMAVGPYPRPHLHQRSSPGTLAQNIASQLYMLKQANSVGQEPQQFDARNNSYRHQNYHQQFNAHSGFRRH